MTATLDRPAIAPASGRSPSRRTPALVGLLAFAIAVSGAWIPSVWYDEAATISSATRSWSQLVAEIGTVDLVHALYYAFMHVWFDIVGYTPLTLRLPSALAVGAAAALVVVLGRQFDRARLGVIAGVVFALLPRTAWAGTEGRSYAITALLAIALTVVLVAASRSPHPRRWWIAYGALALVSVLTFVYLAFVVVAHAVTIALWMRHRRIRPVTAVRWLAAAAAAGVISLPFVYATTQQTGQVFWLGPLSRTTLVGIFREQWFYDSYPFAVAGWAAMAVGAVVLLRRPAGRPLATLLLPALVAPTLLLVIVTATVTPLYTPRYLTLGLPFVALLIAAAIDALRSRVLVAASLALVVLLAAPSIVDQREPLAKENTAWNEVADLVASERAAAGPDARVAVIYGTVQFHPRATSRVISYAYPDAFVGTTDVTLVTPAAETGRLWEEQAPLTESLDRVQAADVVILLTSRARDDTDATTAALDGLGWQVADRTTIGDARIVRYER